MWAKWIVRVLATVYIVGGVVSLLAPESTGRFSRWFGNHPLLIRLDGIAVIALGTVLALREYRRKNLHSRGGAAGPGASARMPV